jgi:electron transfer flavoprotein alpha subunit
LKKIYIIEEKCDGCGKCLKACGFDAIKIKNKKAIINIENCTLCKACLKVCKTEAIIISAKKTPSAKGNYQGVWVFIESINGDINPSCFQILAKGYDLASKIKNELTAILVGNNFENTKIIRESLSVYGVNKIKYLQSEKIQYYQPEDVAEIMRNEIMDEKPAIFLLLGTVFGRAVAPRLAAKLKTGITADCTDLYIDNKNNLVQVRPTYGGRILATIKSRKRPQLATVRPNVFDTEIKGKPFNESIKIEHKEVEIDTIEAIKKVVKTIARKDKNPLIDDAEIVICGGVGMGSKEKFNQLYTLASKIGAAVGGTRAAVDEGWIEFSRQIGQTGKIIRPRLYIGLGVSGAIHHLTGMKNAEKIIAINKDAKAPIFKISDLGIITEVEDILPKLMISI